MSVVLPRGYVRLRQRLQQLVVGLMLAVPLSAQSPLAPAGCILKHTISADTKGERSEAWLAYATRGGEEVRKLGIESGNLKGMMRAAKDCKKYLKQTEKASKVKK